MPFTSDREALRALVDAPDDAALREAVCVHLLSPDPTIARLRRSLCETAAALDSVDRRLLVQVQHPYGGPRGEVTRARALLQETAR